MNIALEIISDSLLFGGFEKYADIPDSPVLFTGLDKQVWEWLKNYHAKHGVTPRLDVFRDSFPQASYPLLENGDFKGTSELVDLAYQKIRNYGIADLITKTIEQHDKGDTEKAVGLIREFAANADRLVNGSSLRMVSADDLDDLPDPVMQIDGLVQAGTVNQLTGFWGTGKSFLALDWALCIATGKEWFGHRVKQGNVIYVAAEGGSGIKKRVRAWKDHYGMDSVAGMTVVLQPVNMSDAAQLAEFCRIVRNANATMVILDTQQRCTTGLDENFTKDMSVLIDGLNAIRDAVEDEFTTVLSVHHTGYEKSRGRGSSAVAAAMDGIFNITSDEPSSLMKLDHQKAKDFARHDEIGLRLVGTGASQIIAENEMPEVDRESGTERIDLQDFADTDEGITSADVQRHFGWTQTKANRMLKSAVKEKTLVIMPETRGRATVYQLASRLTSSHD